MLLLISAVLVILWLLGLVAQLSSAVINFILLMAVAAALFHFLTRPRAT